LEGRKLCRVLDLALQEHQNTLCNGGPGHSCWLLYSCYFSLSVSIIYSYSFFDADGNVAEELKEIGSISGDNMTFNYLPGENITTVWKGNN